MDNLKFRSQQNRVKRLARWQHQERISCRVSWIAPLLLYLSALLLRFLGSKK